MSDPESNASGGSVECLFLSEFKNRVDDKRRVQIPSSWRRGKGTMRFLLLPMPKGQMRPACVMAVTQERFMKMVHELRQMKVMDERADSLRRLLASKAYEVETDSVGRICLPENLTRGMGIEIQQDAQLAGMIDWFEIWNPERYAALSEGDQVRATEAYSMF